ncbi:MAG: hypothetical protein ACRCVJ_05795 [Clostridium sp.]
MIGKKPTKLNLVITIVVCLVISLVISNFLVIITKSNNMKEVIFTFVFIAIVLLYVPTVAICRKHWDITEDYLEYYSITNYFEQVKYALSIFTGKDDVFYFKIKLNEIEKIKIYWTTELSIYSTIAHPIFFYILLKDGSSINFESLVTTSNEEYLLAIKYLENNYNILIDDEYNLLCVLKDSTRNLVDYINEIEDELKKSVVE